MSGLLSVTTTARASALVIMRQKVVLVRQCGIGFVAPCVGEQTAMKGARGVIDQSPGVGCPGRGYVRIEIGQVPVIVPFSRT